MQAFIATGRLCNNPRTTESSTGMKKATFSLAIPRDFKKEGFPDADFFFCVAYGDKAKFIESYIKKGMKVEIKGEIQTYSYVENEKTYYAFCVILNYIGFGESKSANERYKDNSGIEADTDVGADDIRREPYSDDFVGVDAMVECQNCHSIVPPLDSCIECEARLQ